MLIPNLLIRVGFARVFDALGGPVASPHISLHVSFSAILPTNNTFAHFRGARMHAHIRLRSHAHNHLLTPRYILCSSLLKVRRVLMESKELGYGSDGRGGESDVTAATTRAAVSKIEGALRSLEEAEDEVASLIELSKDADPEMREAALEELALARDAVVAAEAEVSRQVAPRPPADEGNAVLEIRGGTGGREAALFALDLWHMYVYCPPHTHSPTPICVRHTQTLLPSLRMSTEVFLPYHPSCASSSARIFYCVC